MKLGPKHQQHPAGAQKLAPLLLTPTEKPETGLVEASIPKSISC